jgi:chemosensory pili system protein ChpC
MAQPTARRNEEVYGQLIPLDGDALLLPNSAVIEVRSLEDMRIRSGQPGWLLGFVRWRDRQAPVVSLEGILGRNIPARSRRSRLLMINSLGTHVDAGLIGIVCQGYPHLTALNRTALQATHREPRDPAELVLVRVKVANTLAIIPDLDAVEAQIKEALPAVLQEPAADWRPAYLQ